MNIPKNISEYLLNQGKVFFPGLGTLKIIQKDAGVQKGKFSPPVSDLDFTSEVIQDEENHFPGFISESENCRREDANQAILEYVDDIKFAFSKGESFHVKGICSIAIDDDNNIEVLKDPDFVINPEEFGLDSFEIDGFEEMKVPGEPKKASPVFEREPKKEKIELVLDIDHDMHKFEETYISPRKEESQKAEILHEKKAEKPSSVREIPSSPVQRPPIKRRRRFWISLASAVVLILAVVFLVHKAGFMDRGINLDDFFGGSEELEVNDDFSDVKDEEFNFDEMVGEMEGETATAAPGETEGDNVEDAGTSARQGNYVEYHIIAGSFHTYENARELQQQLTLVGYPSLVIDLGNGIYRVSAISYRDKVTALNELVKFREKTGMESSWLMNLE